MNADVRRQLEEALREGVQEGRLLEVEVRPILEEMEALVKRVKGEVN